MAPYDARAVANYLLDYSQSRAHELTQLRLLKLLYFAHGWYLLYYKRPLVQNVFEAWKHGPVIPLVRNCFKSCGDGPIRIRAESLNIFTGEISPVAPALEASDASFVEAVYNEYVGHTAWQLSDMTHEAGSPWDRLWNAAGPAGRLGLRIHDPEICKHFESLSRRAVLL